MSGCRLVMEGKPSLYVTFERFLGDADEGQLRLYNNTTCEIIVGTGPVNVKSFPRIFKPQENKVSGARVDQHYQIDWGSEPFQLPIVYKVESLTNSSEPPDSESRDIDIHFTIPPARSVLFPVSATSLRQRLNIFVPFYYSWELGPGRDPIEHRVYFYASELPPNAIPAKPRAR